MNFLPFKGRPVALALFIVLALLHLAIVVYNHYHYRTFAYYYGVYNFAFYDFAHLGNNPCTVLFDGTNATFLQDHFSLLLPLLSPLYWPLKYITGTYTLLVLQWIAIVYGGWATYKFIGLRTTKRFLPLCAMLCYFILYSRFASYVADCNLAIMGSAFVPAFLYYFEKGLRKHLVALFLVLLITREDFSLWLVFVCIFLLIEHRKDREKRKLAVVLMMVSLGYFTVVMKLLIPAMETETVKFMLFNYSALGEDAGQALRFILGHPIEAVRLLFVNHRPEAEHDGTKAGFYIIFGLSGGLLLFLRPATLICLVPLLAKKMYNDDALRWGYESYYGIETASILPALVFMVIADMRKPQLVVAVTALVVLATVWVSAYCFAKAYYPHPFTKIKFYSQWYRQRDFPVESYNEALARIPETAVVSASGRILPHLAYRRNIYYFPLGIKAADYICVSVSGDAWPVSDQVFSEKLDSIRASGSWQVEYMRDNAAILKRKAP